MKKSYLYTNNHFAAKSVVNAVMLKAQLGEPIEGEYPPELVERYPDIADLVTARPPQGGGYFAASFTVARLMTSGMRSFSTTSMPEITWPNTVYRAFSCGCGDSRDVDLAVGGRGSPATPRRQRP